MSFPSSSAIRVILVVVLVIVGSGWTGPAAAQQSLDVTLDVPQEAATGESTTLSASVSVPDIRGSYESELTVTFSDGGTQIASETVTVADGETTTVEVSHTFEEPGTHEIDVEATITLAGQEYSAGDSATLDVVEPEPQITIDGTPSPQITVTGEPTVGSETTVTVETDVPSFSGQQDASLTVRLLVDGQEVARKTVSVTSGETTTTEYNVVFESSGSTTVTAEAILTVGNQEVTGRASTTVDVAQAPPETTTLTGAAFAVPPSLEDEVASYRASVPRELEAQAFVLATQDELYIVFTQAEPTEGRATVKGIVLDQQLSSTNLTFGGIAATSVSFDTTGTEASVQAVSENSGDYRLELVRITATYRRLATLTDPDQGNDFTAAETSGILVANPRTVPSLLDRAGATARNFSRSPSAEQVDTAVADPRRPHLHTVSFKTEFWTDTEATVDAIVLDPESAARKFISEYDRAGIAHAERGEPILYAVNETLNPRSMDSVSEIKSQADSLDGEVVSIEARLYQERISVQETLEHNTGCSEDVLKVETSQGSSCVNVVQDELVHGGVAWTTVPQSKADVLFVVGISSRHQDTPTEFKQGRYRVVGEVVPTSRIDPALPDGAVLFVYSLERRGDINYQAVATEAKRIIEARTDQLATRLQAQLGGDTTPVSLATARQTAQNIGPDTPATVSFSPSPRDSVAVSEIQIDTATRLQQVSLQATEVTSVPDDVAAPPTTPIRVLNVSTSAPPEAVDKATIRLRVAKPVIPDGATLTLYRYHDGEWTALDTTVATETETTVVIEATTPGFSYFALASDDGAGAATTEQSSTSNTETSQAEGTTSGSGPGFTPVAAVLAVIVTVLLRRHD